MISKRLNTKLFTVFLFVFLSLAYFDPVIYSAGNKIEFRLILTEGEAFSGGFDTAQYDQRQLRISQVPHFTQDDFYEIDVMRSAFKSETFLFRLKFNERGQEKLRYFIDRFIGKPIAILVDNKIVAVTAIVRPHFTEDSVIVKWSGREKDLMEFAAKVNKKTLSMVSLYIDEEISNNDLEGEGGDEYGEFNRYMEEKRQQYTDDFGATESDREF